MRHLPARYIAPSPWWAKLLPTWVRRAVALPTEFSAGSDYSPEWPVRPGYSLASAMSAFGGLPWVYAATKAISEDVQRLPVVLMRGMGTNARQIDDHPVLDLLERPSSRVSGITYSRQRTLDRILSGNAYTLLLGPGRPTSLLRMHPERVEIVPSADGQPLAYVHDRQRYAWEQVVHVRGPSFEAGPAGLYGQGIVRALHQYLSADFASWQRQAEAQKQGRPAAIASPRGNADLSVAELRWERKQVEEIRHALDRMMSEAHGGVAVLNGGVELDMLSWAPDQMDHGGLHARVRDAVLAVTGVPPVRLGLSTANYATANAEMRGYWSNTIAPLVAEMDEADTRLAQMFGSDLWVTRSMRNIPELQEDRTARLARVQTLWAMGLTLADALAAEGFDDIEAPATEARPAAEDPDDPAERIARAFWAEERADDAARAERRRTIWRLRTATEPRLERAANRYLRGARERYVARVAEVLGDEERAVTRVLSETDLARIVASMLEQGAISQTFADEVLAAMGRAFDTAVSMLQGWAPDTTPVFAGRARQLVALMSPRIEAATAEAVVAIVQEGIAGGSTIREIQAELMRSEAFSPVRALRIARTEATHAMEQGADVAYQDAAQMGVEFDLEWIAQIDDATRDDHADMDGQVRAPGEPFTTPDGSASALMPGHFGVASLDINCRCGRAPVLREE